MFICKDCWETDIGFLDISWLYTSTVGICPRCNKQTTLIDSEHFIEIEGEDLIFKK